MKIILILAAILIGAFCGLLPGVHPNTAGAILAGFEIDGESIAIILVGVLGAYTAISFLPAIFLGVPEGDTIVSLLPGQRMMREGRAQEAILVIGISLCVSAIISFFIVYLFLGEFSRIFEFVRPFTAYILIFFCTLLLLREKRIWKILFASLVFLLAGILGFLSLNSHMSQPLFSLFAGFFALPALLMHKDFFGKGFERKEIDKTLGFIPHVLFGIFLGGIADLLPGISTPSQLAVFGSLIERQISARNFLAQIASIEASHCIFSIGSAASAGVARVGAVAMARQAWEFSLDEAFLLMGVFLTTLGVGVVIILHLGGRFEKYVRKKRVAPLTKIIAIYLVLLAFVFDGTFGVLVLGVAGLIGFLPIIWGVSRTHVMGSIILVSILRAILV